MMRVRHRRVLLFGLMPVSHLILLVLARSPVRIGLCQLIRSDVTEQKGSDIREGQHR